MNQPDDCAALADSNSSSQRLSSAGGSTAPRLHIPLRAWVTSGLKSRRSAH